MSLAYSLAASGRRVTMRTSNGRSEGSVRKRTLHQFIVGTIVDQTGGAWHFLHRYGLAESVFAGINRGRPPIGQSIPARRKCPCRLLRLRRRCFPPSLSSFL